MNKTFILFIVFLIILFNVAKNNNSFNFNKKSNLRKLLDWEEDVQFNSERDFTQEEKDSIDHCKTNYDTDYKYNIFYEVGKNYTFDDKDLVEENVLFATPLFKEIRIGATKKEESNDWGKYLQHIGLFFFFVGCAGVSIIVWIFNWICWLNQCCCCDFLHNPVNKRIAWWTSFIFLLGVLACCISGFVTVKRFGFALEGSRCAFDRIYYDALYGQLKNSIPRWEGISHISKLIENIKCDVKNLIPSEGEFTEIQNDYIFMEYFHNKQKVLKDSLNILAMIYFCLLLIAVVSAGVSMMFYACLKRQGYLITLMHILWNVIRFFIFSFFLYGTAYGVSYKSFS